jgi:protein ImuA
LRAVSSGIPKAQRLEALRQAVAVAHRQSPCARPPFPFGIAEIDECLAGGGLACGLLHEVSAGTHRDRPAALGFVCALMAAALRLRPGQAVFVASRRSLPFGALYARGLAEFGVDPGRLLVVETRNDRDALWALEEALRAGAPPAVVAGAVEMALDLTVSRRLNIAATVDGTPLFLSRPAGGASTASATRWRIASAPAGRDRFGAFARYRWRASLERCRNGRTG